tara:strand:- start:388 stop:897 length:510 start_codon:yes stop_codon:yes gene_type:complete
MTDTQKADLLFSEAVYRVYVRRNDFETMVMEAKRQIAAKQPAVDPVMSAMNMQVGLLADPNSTEFTKARLELVDAVLHCWFKVTPDVQSAVMDAVRDIAIMDDVDELTALGKAYAVIERHRGAGSAMADLREASKAKLENQRQKRDKLTKDRTRQRLERQDAVGSVYSR